MLQTEGQAFLERIDDWLSAHQVEADAADDGIRLGVGMYQIEDRVTRRPKTPKTKNESGEPR
jgi:hypothetical protein